jgi:hypothetical protein
MNDVTLISVDDIKEVTSISKSISPELLEPYILISEEYFVYDLLGSALTNELKNQITGNSLSQLNSVLLTQYIRPLAAYGAWHEYIPFSAIRSTQKGEVKQSSDSSVNADLNEVAFKRTALKDKVMFFQNRVEKYLNENKTKYPLYRASCNGNGWNSTGIYLGKY